MSFTIVDATGKGIGGTAPTGRINPGTQSEGDLVVMAGCKYSTGLTLDAEGWAEVPAWPSLPQGPAWVTFKTLDATDEATGWIDPRTVNNTAIAWVIIQGHYYPDPIPDDAGPAGGDLLNNFTMLERETTEDDALVIWAWGVEDDVPIASQAGADDYTDIGTAYSADAMVGMAWTEMPTAGLTGDVVCSHGSNDNKSWSSIIVVSPPTEFEVPAWEMSTDLVLDTELNVPEAGTTPRVEYVWVYGLDGEQKAVLT